MEIWDIDMRGVLLHINDGKIKYDFAPTEERADGKEVKKYELNSKNN